MTLKIDEKDRKILDVLKEHSDWTTRKIAKKTLLPITTIHNRIRRLRSLGVIKKYTVDLDYSKLDRGFLVHLLVHVSLPLLKQKRKSQYDVLKDLKKLGFVVKADIVSGGADLFLTVRVKDVADYDKALLTKIQKIDGIEKTSSLIVIHEGWLKKKKEKIT